MCCLLSACTVLFFFFKQKTAYEMRISDWSSDVCSSDLMEAIPHELIIIGGAAAGALIIGNSGKELKALGGGLVKVFKGPKYRKQDYLDTIFLVSKLMKMLRKIGRAHV